MQFFVWIQLTLKNSINPIWIQFTLSKLGLCRICINSFVRIYPRSSVDRIHGIFLWTEFKLLVMIRFMSVIAVMPMDRWCILTRALSISIPSTSWTFHENGIAGDSELVCPHKVKSVDLSAVNLSILLDFQTPQVCNWTLALLSCCPFHMGIGY